MQYDQQILKILSDVGQQGISVQNLARHVYNQNCTLFGSPDYADVRQYVQQYLLRNSKSAQSIIESTGRRGFYRLNTQNSADARQLMLEFLEEKDGEEQKEERSQPDQSLDLFSDIFDDLGGNAGNQ